MAYTAIDLLDKIIYTGGKNKNMYDDSLEKLQKNTPNYLVIKVISRNLGISIEYYRKLKEETYNIDLEEIDFIIYDKISFLINEFTYKILLDTRDIKSSIRVIFKFSKGCVSTFYKYSRRTSKEWKRHKHKGLWNFRQHNKRKGKKYR